MTKNKVKKILKDMGINAETISFYQEAQGFKMVPVYDTEFTYCDISSVQGECVNCVGLSEDGELVNFMALDSLIGGALGSLAGAF